jgi:hypothetical protein
MLRLGALSLRLGALSSRARLKPTIFSARAQQGLFEDQSTASFVLILLGQTVYVDNLLA